MAERYWPLGNGRMLTSPFGWRDGFMHYGADFGREGGSGGMPVYAAQSGTVVYSGAASGFGGPSPAGWVVVDHPTEAGSGTTVYGHVIAEVNVGDYVQAGQRIARVNPDSNTNGGYAPHLHFELHPTVWQRGSQQDPMPWLAGALEPEQNQQQPAPAQPAAPGGIEGFGGTVFGVDVSEHQDGMSLRQAANEGIQFAIIRTTDGDYRDRCYRSHLDDAESAGLVTAAYHFLRNPSEGTTVEQQVDASLAVMGDARRPMWLDCETEAGLSVEHIREAKRLFEAAGVRVCGVYSCRGGRVACLRASQRLRNLVPSGWLPTAGISAACLRTSTVVTITSSGITHWGINCLRSGSSGQMQRWLVGAPVIHQNQALTLMLSGAQLTS